MKAQNRNFILFLLAGILLLPTIAFGEVVERIVARVNSDIIFLSELEEFGKRYFEEVQKNSSVSESREKVRQAKREVLDQLIEMKILDQEIKKRKVEVPERDVDAAVDDIVKRNNFTVNDLKMALAKEGMTYTSYRERIRDDLGKMRLISREIKSKIMIKEEDLRKVYKEKIQEFMIPLEVQVQQIFFTVARDSSKEQIAGVEKEAQAVLEKAKKGEDFSELARKYSRSPEAKDGGVLGYFKQKELLPELDEAVFQMKIGEISRLVRSPDGFHILRVMDRKGGEPKPFLDVQNRLREEMMQAESEKQFKQWMKDLKEKAYIEIKL